MHKLYTYMIPC